MTRLKRVAQLLRQEIATILFRKIRSPKVMMVSILDVDVSADFRKAKVYYSFFGPPEDIRKTQKFLSQSKRLIKGELGKVLRLKTIPDLCFIYDNPSQQDDTLTELIDHHV